MKYNSKERRVTTLAEHLMQKKAKQVHSSTPHKIVRVVQIGESRIKAHTVMAAVNPIYIARYNCRKAESSEARIRIARLLSCLPSPMLKRLGTDIMNDMKAMEPKN